MANDVFTIEVNGQRIKAHPGETLLNALQREGIGVPTLCHDERLTPHGGCRLCLVARRDAGGDLIAACHTPVHADCAQLHGRCVTLGCPGLSFQAARPSARRRALTPALPWRARWRPRARSVLEVALAPSEDVALVVLGLGGLLGLALLV